MKLYCIPNCDECENVKEVIEKMGKSQIEVVDLKLVDDKYIEKTTDGFKETNYRAFPVLYFGELGDQAYALVGESGIKEFLEKGFVHEVKMCPMTQKDCVESKCEWFSVLMNGLIPDANCAIKWLPVLTTETMSILKKR